MNLLWVPVSYAAPFSLTTSDTQDNKTPSRQNGVKWNKAVPSKRGGMVMATKNEYKNFSLGPAGEASPAYLPPGKIPEGPLRHLSAAPLQVAGAGDV